MSRQKNAVDIPLAVNAINLYKEEGLKKFFIMSNDGDYLYLVNFLRERGCSVFGFGTMAVNQLFRDSFDEYFFADTGR